MAEHQNKKATLPMTLEEQAALLLYSNLRPLLVDTVNAHEKAYERIVETINEVVRCTKDELTELLEKERAL